MGQMSIFRTNQSFNKINKFLKTTFWNVTPLLSTHDIVSVILWVEDKVPACKSRGFFLESWKLFGKLYGAFIIHKFHKNLLESSSASFLPNISKLWIRLFAFKLKKSIEIVKEIELYKKRKQTLLPINTTFINACVVFYLEQNNVCYKTSCVLIFFNTILASIKMNSTTTTQNVD